MKLLITKNEYGCAKNRLRVDPITLAVSAKSYDWWTYVWTDSVGNVIFKNSRYSVTTSKHQRECLGVLARLNIRPSVVIHHTGTSRHYSAREAIQDEIKCLNEDILDLTEIKKRSHKRKNAERLAVAERHRYRVKDLERFLVENLDKKLGRIGGDGSNWQYYEGKREQVKQHIQHLFLKPNSLKTDRNALDSFVKTNIVPWDSYGVSSIERVECKYLKLSELLGLKRIDLRRVILYKYSLDLENQIPEINSDAFIWIHKFCAKQGITRENFNNFSLDILHTKLTNLQNRPEKSDSERVPERFDYPDFVYCIKPPEHEFIVLDSPVKLRAEGKRQSHCIGGREYISACRKRAMAFSYRGFTFFTDREGYIEQTTGKYNSSTPMEVRAEFMKLIREQQSSGLTYLSERRA